MTQIKPSKIRIILLATLVFSSQIFAAQKSLNSDTFLTADEYPYKWLVRMADSVKIRYLSVDEDVFKCRAQIEYGETKLVSQYVEVKKTKFASDALKACFPRKNAKSVLADIYAAR